MSEHVPALIGTPVGTQQQYVTVRIASQLFGLPIEMVHEVFAPDAITRVPLSPAAIAGVLNLRGRIVTMLNMRCLLGLPPAEGRGMAVGIEHDGEAFGLMIDDVGEVLGLDAAKREPNPSNLDPRWAAVAAGVHRLSGELMLILNVDLVLRGAGTVKAAVVSRY
ncbi:chemotaxis protein CheW [Xanthobacter agilis]|jgi:purine-binding chemotaxis protein CheW|uniref:Purine-binding chemotaxis protein CheW n=1 Tax=Xanthobacter agilis TaxID=47492 RepID=A0ABU0LHT4_XANAG|nr:chemotaxis protein CheW [Xanthobacter agilis]MDQ0506695.1 purine-binding chemotaxis protein CheW [Xanthobacter agilis]